MPRKRHTEEQIISILKKYDAGMKTQDLCREHGISTPTFYKWKAKFGGMDVSDAKRLKALENENGKLKRIVADQAVDMLAMKELLSKKKASQITGMARSGHYYKRRLKDDEPRIIKRMKELIKQQNTIGCEMMHDVLRREGLVVNHKRTERIYREEKFSLKMRKRKSTAGRNWCE